MNDILAAIFIASTAVLAFALAWHYYRLRYLPGRWIFISVNILIGLGMIGVAIRVAMGFPV